MTRPSQHGATADGEGPPPIAGDVSSFPSDAELARTLAAGADRATLCTLTADGYPYGSAISFSLDDDGSTVFLMSEMAEHTVNANGEPKASLLIAADPTPGADPLSAARLTLVGRLAKLADPGVSRDRYLERHAYAAYYADYTDFAFWRLTVERCRYIGGFGHMSWVTADQYRDAGVDPLVAAVDGITAHMNDDHADANLTFVQRLADLPEATAATMVGVDRYGMTFQVVTPERPRLARVAFPDPLTHADQAEHAVIGLLRSLRDT